MRLQLLRLPDALDGSQRQVHGLGHGARVQRIAAPGGSLRVRSTTAWTSAFGSNSRRRLGEAGQGTTRVRGGVVSGRAAVKNSRHERGGFLEHAIEAFPYRIPAVLTDNGVAFADLLKNRFGPNSF